MTRVPDIKTPLPGPRATALIARDRARVSPSYTRDYPFVMARGAGAVVEDIDGNVFLDCAAGIAVTGTGHAHPDVVAAITAQAQKYLHMSGTDFYYEPQVQLAGYKTGRVNVIAFLGSFHGRTMGSLAATSSRFVQRRGFGPMMPGMFH